jgi:hypothetical protein
MLDQFIYWSADGTSRNISRPISLGRIFGRIFFAFSGAHSFGRIPLQLRFRPGVPINLRSVFLFFFIARRTDSSRINH